MKALKGQNIGDLLSNASAGAAPAGGAAAAPAGGAPAAEAKKEEKKEEEEDMDVGGMDDLFGGDY